MEMYNFIRSAWFNYTLSLIAQYFTGERTVTFCRQTEELAYLSLATIFPKSL
jgi:hypothetical protein